MVKCMSVCNKSDYFPPSSKFLLHNIFSKKIRLKNYFKNNFSKKNIYFLNFFPPRGVESPRPRHKIMMMMMMMMIVMMSMMIIMMSHLIFVQLWLDREARQS